jgi:hypothetical protein
MFFRSTKRRITRQEHIESIQLVQSPVLLYQHLILDETLPINETSQQVFELVEKSIENAHQTHNLVVAIDIICSPEFIFEGYGADLAQSILFELDQSYPELRDRFVGVSDDEKHLVLKDLMCTGALAWEEIDNQHLFVFE